MKTKKRLIFVLLGFIALTGCDKTPRIDGSDEQAFRDSFRVISESLPKEKREKFELDLMRVGYNGINQNKLSDSEIRQRMMKKVDGMTAAEIFEAAEQIRSK